MAAELDRRRGRIAPDYPAAADRTGEYPAIPEGAGVAARGGRGGRGGAPAAGIRREAPVRNAATDRKAGSGTTARPARNAAPERRAGTGRSEGTGRSAGTPKGGDVGRGTDGRGTDGRGAGAGRGAGTGRSEGAGGRADGRQHAWTGASAGRGGQPGAGGNTGSRGRGGPATQGAEARYGNSGRYADTRRYLETGHYADTGRYPETAQYPETGGYDGTGEFGEDGEFGGAEEFGGADGLGEDDGFGRAGGYPPGAGAVGEEPDERTEVLINRGRRSVQRTGVRRWLAHWRAIGISLGAVVVGSTLLAVILPGASASWPASVAQVRADIALACQNPNVVSEPTEVDFACAKSTQQILWVFSLLTSGDNPDFTDPATGREGLEPITPTQGGDVAWSLNLHHPYNPASPTDSLEVAARAINDIIGGATLTSSTGSPEVQPGLESSAANCARYTGSSALVTRQGFPAICALPVTSPQGQAALVSDVFQQWMLGTPSRIAAEAGVLFENAENPGDPRVQAILNSLPDSGL